MPFGVRLGCRELQIEKRSTEIRDLHQEGDEKDEVDEAQEGFHAGQDQDGPLLDQLLQLPPLFRRHSSGSSRVRRNGIRRIG